MAIPKKHLPRVTKFVEIVLGMVVREELARCFYKRGPLDSNYVLVISNNVLLPPYNDDRIEFFAQVNDKKVGPFTITGEDLAKHNLDPKLVKEVVDGIMKIRIKEMK
ncbi:hypothetical protein SUREIYA_00340 [Serratia phage vB_SmaM-Sureiya]|nr:hypothetical protein SUREIYA_00340 [Serratia phage vB_SmaM-Sureiya]